MKKHASWKRELVEIIALALLIFVAMRVSIQNYSVPISTMQPSLRPGEYVLVNKVSYLFHSPQRGDVVVLHQPQNTDMDIIKRVIAVPGDTVAFDSTAVRVNGVQLKEPYVSNAMNPVAKEMKLGANDYFVMDDNRQNTDDSRNWGPLNRDLIIGKAALVYWPSSQWKNIDTYTDQFAQIK